ncbi:MAG: 16S rRNA (cytosine(967)-C(5))-methyltransferase RsmB [Legionellaceae bacterium]|nr:16S rRNA (cytosine(967)-C(5))-methyltransferase RsmB [Legionellaceae bacterium]
MKKSEREDALQILTKLIEEKKHLSYFMQSNDSLSPLTKEICFGVCRYYHRLDILANHLLNKKPKDISVFLSILIGLYQLHYLNIPDYAVVKETVDLLQKLKKNWAKGLVNAILRKYCREKETIAAKLSTNEIYNYSHPEWFINNVKADWPNDWKNILQANNQHPPMSLRVNNAKKTTREYLEDLNQADMQGATSSIAPTNITLAKPCGAFSLPGFENGDVSVQDIAAQLAIPLLDLKPNLSVLDACCAPGGKTCHILEAEPNLGKCVAIDIESNRLSRVHENLQRLGLSASIQQGDALDPKSWWDGYLFDRILLDAPCSATGVIRRHPDIKLLRTKSEINLIIDIQRQILKSLWGLLAPGGRMVYATCSIIPDENERQIEKFVAKQDDCQCLIEEKTWGHASKYGWQILPGEHNMDGFFYSVLIKSHK